MTPQIDIIMPVRSTRTYPVESYLEKSYDSLIATTQHVRMIFVDDNSDEVGAQLISDVAKRRRDTILIRTHYQRWFTRAVNLGLRMARTEWVAVVNSDTEFGSGWLDELFTVRDEAQAQTGTRVGLVGSVLSQEEQRRWALSQGKDYVTGHAWLLSMMALYECSAARGMPGIYLDETVSRNIHIRSDVEICWDMNKLGWNTVKSFKSAVGHHGGKSWGYDVGKVQALTLAEVSDHYE